MNRTFPGEPVQATWNVMREMYVYIDDDHGKPRARPFDISKHKSYVEASDCGAGKSHQLHRLVLKQFTPRDGLWRTKMYESITGREPCERRMTFCPTSENTRPCTCGGEGDSIIAASIGDTPYVGCRVILIFHRITLINAINIKYFKALGFHLYSETEACQNSDRLIICIDSLWKVKH